MNSKRPDHAVWVGRLHHNLPVQAGTRGLGLSELDCLMVTIMHDLSAAFGWGEVVVATVATGQVNIVPVVADHGTSLPANKRFCCL
jgi:hypothetical protein